MTRSKGSVLFVMLVITGTLWMFTNGCGGGSSSSTNPQPQIQHIVIIFQENRSPDNLFQDPALIQRGADIQNYGINLLGVKEPLTPQPLATNWDNMHNHASFLAMYDGGKMDGAQSIPVHCMDPTNCTPPINRPFNYVQASDVQPYYSLAETYTFGDRFFQTNQGPSLPAHSFIISGTSAPAPSGQKYGNYFVAENARTSIVDNTGCLASPGDSVLLIDPANMDPNTNETVRVFPCFDHPTLTDLFDGQGISWRYYAWTAGTLWNGPTEISHICGPNPPPPNSTECSGQTWKQNVITNPAQVLTDIQNNQLASVTWVTPSVTQSDHAGTVSGDKGPSWVASIVNTLGNSSYWANTAIIITWDDWGGWYDHVAPSILNSYEYGFRVPIIVVSPYAKAGYVSHQVNDFGSILKFVEKTFNLPTVAPGASPAYADEIPNTNDLSDYFDFTQTPLTFKATQARQDANYFIHDKTPLGDPDDD